MTTKTNQQHRCIDGQAAVKRSDDGKTFIEWYPSVFNQRSKLIREYGETFFEIIAPGAFTRALEKPELNCLATVDHAREKMIGRNKSGTLQLSVDDIGLKATVEVPDTTLGRDMVVMIERGDYFEGSFIYTIADKGVTYDRSQKIAVRTVTEAADLYDVSIVIDGAFANTAIKLRSSELPDEDSTIEPTEAELVEARALANEYDILEKELEILNLKK